MFCFDLDSTQRRALKLMVIITTIAIVITAIVFHVVLETGVWADYNESLPCDAFCENSHACDHELEDRPAVQQPVNSWTNLGYFMVGLWPLVHRFTLARLIFFLANTYLFVGSFGFHASLTRAWVQMDVSGMYTVLAAVICHGVHALTGMPWWILAPGVTIFGILLPTYWFQGHAGAWLAPMVMMKRCLMILASLTALLVVARIVKIVRQPPSSSSSTATTNTTKPQRSKWKQIVAVIGVAIFPAIIFGVAYWIWTQDKNKTWCNPQSMLQGHGAWHVLTAFATYFPWKFFDENRVWEMFATPSTHSPTEEDSKGTDNNKGHDDEDSVDGITCKPSDDFLIESDEELELEEIRKILAQEKEEGDMSC